jgi:hypothetical protein
MAPESAASLHEILLSLKAGRAEFVGIKLEGPLVIPEGAAITALSLVPLATAEGNIHAQIVNAHLMFDADVTVPIRHGQIDLDDATVEHVGPDSRMGVSRLGLYVDAPNGRNYLFQFHATPVAGVEFEQRGALLGPWVSDRGKLFLQEFAEGFLRQHAATASGAGVTDQARLVLDRTTLSGEVRLGDGRIAAQGVEAELAGRAEGHNALRIHSQAVGLGLTVEVASLLARNARLTLAGVQLVCDQVTGAFTLRLIADEKQKRFEIEISNLQLTGLRLQPDASHPAPGAGG